MSSKGRVAFRSNPEIRENRAKVQVVLLKEAVVSLSTHSFRSPSSDSVACLDLSSVPADFTRFKHFSVKMVEVSAARLACVVDVVEAV